MDRGDIGARRLGGLRQPVDGLFVSLGVDVVVPLIDRGLLVGAIGATAPTTGRALRDSELELVSDMAAASAKALAYIHLFQEAETGSPTEYAQIEQTWSEEAMKRIADWILKVTE